MSDPIDRQAAIDAVMDEFKRVPTTAIRAKARLESLPSAQPQLVRCKDCKLWPWRPLKFMDRAVELTCCEFTRGPEGFCAWGERRQEEQDG